MNRFVDARLAPGSPCPYIQGNTFVQEYFFAAGLSRQDMGDLLEKGWRRFGMYFFRPQCGTCRECRPLRIPVRDFVMSESQKRVYKRNHDTEVIFKDLEFREEIYDVYLDHSRSRFGKDESLNQFLETFFEPSAPAGQTEYYVGGELAGVGFCDLGHEGLSSVYFVFKDKFKHRSLGVFSVLKEIEIARELGLSYYYLGYWVRENPHMAYKGNYRVREIMDWDTYKWTPQ